MANELMKVSYTLPSGAPMELDSMTVRNYICTNPKVTNQEIMLFLKLCEMERLDPLGKKEAFLIKFGDSPAQQVVAYKVLNKRAKASQRYEGDESGITVINVMGDLERRPGELKLNGEELVGAWARVYIKGYRVPTYAEVNWSEYNKGQALWKEKPATMIHKVARAHAFRQAFPDEVGSLYIEDEMTPDLEASTAAQSEPVVEFISRARLAYLTRNVDKKDKNQVAQVSAILKQHGATTLDNVPLSADASLEKILTAAFPGPKPEQEPVEVEQVQQPEPEPMPEPQPEPVKVSRPEKMDRPHCDERPINFGKHKGKMLCEMPDEYLQWVLANMEIKNDQYREANIARNRTIEEYLGVEPAQEQEYPGEEPEQYYPDDNVQLPFDLDR